MQKLAEFVSELRFVKDEYEIAEMRKAVAASIEGFKSVVRNLDRAVKHPRGERIVEGAFFAEARPTATSSAMRPSPPPVSTPAFCTGSSTTEKCARASCCC
jgi:Xaa-Pro aminopeptidase